MPSSSWNTILDLKVVLNEGTWFAITVLSGFTSISISLKNFAASLKGAKWNKDQQEKYVLWKQTGLWNVDLSHYLEIAHISALLGRAWIIIIIFGYVTTQVGCC